MIWLAAILIAVFASVGLGSAGATPQTPATATGGSCFLGQRRRPDAAHDHDFGAVDPPLDEQRPGVPAHHRHCAWRLDQLAGCQRRHVSEARRLQPDPEGLGGLDDPDRRWCRASAVARRRAHRLPRQRQSRAAAVHQSARHRPHLDEHRLVCSVSTAASWTLRVSSTAKRGKRHMGRGVHAFVVNASGTWTIGWKP